MNDTPDLSLTTEQKPLRSLRELYFEIGIVLSSQEPARLTEAISAYEHALEEHDSPLPSGEIYARLARTYECIGNIPQAFHFYLKAIADAPHWTSNLLPCVHALLKRLTPETLDKEQEWLQQEWLSELSKTELSEAERASIALFLGRTNLYLERYAKARDYYEQAQQMNPQSFHILEGLGQALMHLGELDQSAEVFKQAYNLAKQENQTERVVAICNKLARVLAAEGQYEAALMQFGDTYSLVGEKLYSVPDYTCKMYLTSAQCFLALGDAANALKAIEAASGYDLLKSSTTARTTYNLLRTRIFISLRQYIDALSAANEALQQDPFSNEALLCKLQTLFEGVIDVEQARRQFRRYKKKVDVETALANAKTAATATQQADGNGHYFLAQVYYILERYPEARQELDQASQLKLTNASSANVALTQLKAELFEAEGHTQEAAEHLYLAGRELYTTTTKYAEAIELLTHAVELIPDHGLALLFLSASLSLQASTTTPPSEELLKQALETWDKSYAIGLPPVNPAWAYAVRAGCLAQMADLNPDNADYLLWEAVCHLERAVILDSSQAYLWDMLLGDYINLHMSATALQISKQHPTPYGQASTLYFQDDEQAIHAIDQAATNPDVSMDYYKAFWFYLRGKYDDAIQTIQNFQQLFPNRDTAELHYFLGRLYLLIGKSGEALAKFQWIWDATSPGGKFATDDNLAARANSAFELGHYHEALSIYQRLLAGGGKKSYPLHSSHAYCHILLGQLDVARQELNESLNYINHIVEGHSAVLDIIELENKLRKLADSASKQDLLQQHRAKLEEQIRELQRKTSDGQDAVEELLLVLKDTQGQQGSFSWLAAQAGLARMDIAARSWQSAITRYETLLQYKNEDSSRCFPEASIGLARSYALFGCDLALHGDGEAALNYLKHSLDLYAQAGQSNPALVMILDCSQLISSHEQYSLICQCLRSLADVYSLDYSERQNLLAARLKLSREKYPGIIHPTELNDASDGGKTSEWKNQFGWKTPTMGSFTIELGLDLLIVGDHTTIVDSVEADLMNTCLPQMRARIREQFGVIVPGLQIRDNTNIDANTYQFLSFGKILDMGSVLPREKYCPDAKSCQALGIDGTLMLNPRDGSEGLWLQIPEWEQAQKAGLPIWNPYEYITFHLETLVQANLRRLIGVEETQATIQEWVVKSKKDRQELAKLALPDDLAIARLAQVLRGLVEEQVSIANLEIILQVFARENARASNILDIIEAIRSALNSVLPGNNAGQEATESLPQVSEQIRFSSNTTSQEAAHLQSDANPVLEAGPTLAPDILPSVLKSLVDLGILDANEALVSAVIDAGRVHHISAEDIVEIAFARLRSSRIKIQLTSEYVNMETDSVSDHRTLPELFQVVEEKLFYERGILLPEFDPLPSTGASDNRVQINDQSILLVPMSHPSTDELAKKLFDILSKEAKALISIDDLEYRMAHLYITHPTLIKAALARFSLEDLTRAARGLVSKGESILDLRLMLEQLLEFDTVPIAPATYAI